ncbi:hypothetical protein [Nocardioides yefusunii]|uniref:Uncharacterized protein n=1 Tax=Nocardioides yefusunii TaxID=2500546 RepID=A0ABW1QY90_9ACTN|nr:hypothetical protein [Nocardioides yefusunii]
MSTNDIDTYTRASDWEGVKVLVAGFGVAGRAATDNLNHLGASVVAVDEQVAGLDEAEAAEFAERAELMNVLGAEVRLGAGVADSLPDDVDLLVVSPGWASDHPLVEQAMVRGIPVWGEVELAWRLRDPAHETPWLVVTGSRGRARVAAMTDSILRTEGRRSVVVGNGALSPVEIVMEPDPYDAVIIDASAAQLHHTFSMSAHSAVVTGLGQLDASEHPAWHASFEDYVADTARVYHQVQQSCIFNVNDERTMTMVEDADVVEGARAIGFTPGMPAVSMVGMVEDILADRAFIPQRTTSAAELCTLEDLDTQDPERLLDALAAAALARSFGASQAAVRDGLRAFRD